MFWHGPCFDVIDILTWSMFWKGQCFGMVDVLAHSIFWRCWFLAHSIFLRGLCLGRLVEYRSQGL